jgi:hypothetical protein
MPASNKIKMFYESRPIDLSTLEESKQHLNGKLIVSRNNLVATKYQTNSTHAPFSFWLSNSTTQDSYHQTYNSLIAQVTGRTYDLTTGLIDNEFFDTNFDFDLLEHRLLTKKSFIIGPGFAEMVPYFALKRQGVIQTPKDIYEIPLEHLLAFTPEKTQKISIIDAVSNNDLWILSKFIAQYFPKDSVDSQLNENITVENFQRRLSVYQTGLASWYTRYIDSNMPIHLQKLKGKADFVFSVQAIEDKKQLRFVASFLLGQEPNEDNSLLLPRIQIKDL